MAIKIGANTVISDDLKGYFDTLTYEGVAILQYNQGPQGVNYGYASGGQTSSFDYSNVIDRFPFSTATTNAADVGDLTVGASTRGSAAGQSSETYGYISGGTAPSNSNIIERWPFAASTTDAADVGDLTVVRSQSAGQSSSTHGYTSGSNPAITSGNVIDRFPFAVSTTDAADVGDLIELTRRLAGQSSADYGYVSGGLIPTPGVTNIIQRFPFAASTTDAADVGDLTVARDIAAGQSSYTYGYTSGGNILPTLTDVIDRFPFASSSVNATDVGDLTVARNAVAGQSSSEYGYSSGDYTPAIPAPTKSNVIDRFPFAVSTTNASDVGDLTIARGATAGQQY